MKLLVLATDYPKPNGYIQLMFIHVRNKYYRDMGFDVTVLNFNSKDSYEIDGIQVISLNEYKNKERDYKFDILVSHASNIRNHYRFLKRYEKNFNKIIFFFHGHEVLRLNSVYPKPYSYMDKTSAIKKIGQHVYDSIKLKLWREYYTKLSYKSHYIFVSKWIYNEFLYWTKISPRVIRKRSSIIHNSVGDVFEKKSYDHSVLKEYDIISIRGNLDGSKYGVDIINELAFNNPALKFLLIGKGQFFEHFKKSENITWLNKSINHGEMIEYMNKSRCGLLPTRQDTQGVMTCEMATFGLPVITSNIEVCHEILDDFPNVVLIDNNKTDLDLVPIIDELTGKIPYRKNEKYFVENTTNFEVELFKRI